MKKKSIYLLLMLALVLPACKKILEIDRATDANPTPVTVEDFEQILNNPGICEPKDFQLLEQVTDNWFELDGVQGLSPMYLWKVNPWVNGDGDSKDQIYELCYKWIGQMNLVIGEMPTALPSGQMNDRRAVAMARAKINRAYFYLTLVNTYATHYQPTSASTDLGVPLILQVNNQVSVARATVEQVYQQILADLNEALATPGLPNENRSFLIHPSRAAALAVLARTYLYMGNFALAEKAASDALAINSNLMSYLSFGAPGTGSRPLSLLEQKNNPEVLLAKVNFIGGIIYISNNYASSEFKNLFDQTNDRRYKASFTNDAVGLTYNFGLRGTNSFTNYSIGVPEMMLIKAECLARANDAVGAVNLLNRLRATRIVNYTNLSTNVTADAALTLVLQERRRELMFKGLRLFDLKRLNLEARFKIDIVRRTDGGQYIVTLPAGSPNYVFPFTRSAINANSLLVQNPRVELQ